MKLKDMVVLIICTGLIVLTWILLGEIGSGLYKTRAIPFAFRFFNVAVYLLAFKTLWGFHFSWERCKCCGKRYGMHNKDFLGGYLSPIEVETSRAKVKKIKAELDAEHSTKALAIKPDPNALKPIREGKTKGNVNGPPKAGTRPKVPPPPQKKNRERIYQRFSKP